MGCPSFLPWEAGISMRLGYNNGYDHHPVSQTHYRNEAMYEFSPDSVVHRLTGAGYVDARINDADSTDDMTVVYVLPGLSVLLYSDHATVRTTHAGGHFHCTDPISSMDLVFNRLRSIFHPKYGIPTPFDSDRAKEILAEAKVIARYGGFYEQADKVMTNGEKAYVHVVWDRMSGSSSWFSAFTSILQNDLPGERL
jgi:hypothetical protein